jgi:hypothetical protein
MVFSDILSSNKEAAGDSPNWKDMTIANLGISRGLFISGLECLSSTGSLLRNTGE